MKWLRLTPIIVLFLLAACSQKRVTEEDREGIDYTVQILHLQDDELDRLEEATATMPEFKAKYGGTVANLRQLNEDASSIVVTLREVYGPPKEPKTYSHSEVEGLIAGIKKSHAVTFWSAIGASVLAGALTLLAVARSPLAKLIPGAGNILGSLDPALAALQGWMKKKQDGGETDDVHELVDVLHEASPLLGKHAEAIKDKLGIVAQVVDAGEASTAIISTTTITAEEVAKELKV